MDGNLTLLGIAGKKGAGKSTLANFVEDRLKADADMVVFRRFSFAESLKRTCIEALGLSYAQVYGSEASKNTIVPHLLWENFPIEASRRVYRQCGEYVSHLKTGPMTAREVMQHWGNDIFRKANPDVFVHAARNAINEWVEISRWLYPEKRLVAVIDDVRYPNEVDLIRGYGGKVLRLTRDVHSDDHASETVIDDEGFDLVCHNKVGTVGDMTEALTPWLTSIGVFSNGGEAS